MNIVHCKKSPYQIYCGRPSIYGNPYVIGKHGSRAEVISMYQEHFNIRIKEDADFKQEVLKLKDKTCACWCDFPKQDCHLRIFKEWLEKNI